MYKNKKHIKPDLQAFIRELVLEIVESEKTLYAFDLDDTLITSTSKVIVKNNNELKKLTPAEYALYIPKEGDELDFSEFSEIKNPELITKNVKLFLEALKKSSELSKTIILTARTPDIVHDIQALLAYKKLPQVEIYAVGSSDPNKKAEVIQSFIDKGYTIIRFFDDSPANITAVRKLKETNPEADIVARLVKPDLQESKDHEPMNPGILKKRLGKLSCSKVREERAKLKDKGTTYAKALQRYLNYHCND